MRTATRHVVSAREYERAECQRARGPRVSDERSVSVGRGHRQILRPDRALSSSNRRNIGFSDALPQRVTAQLAVFVSVCAVLAGEVTVTTRLAAG